MILGASLVAQWYRILLQCSRSEFNPWVRKIPWKRAWHPTPVFLPGKSRRQRSLAGYDPWGHKESDMTETTEPALEILGTWTLLKQGLHLWLKWGALRQCGSTSLCRHDTGVCSGLHLQLQPSKLSVKKCRLRAIHMY